MIGRIYDIETYNGEIYRISEDYVRNIVKISADGGRHGEFELKDNYSHEDLMKKENLYSLFYWWYHWRLLDKCLENDD